MRGAYYILYVKKSVCETDVVGGGNSSQNH